MSVLPDRITLGEARQWLRERVQDGAECPCCKQTAKVYQRRLNKGMLNSLVAIYQAGGNQRWVDVTTLNAKNREHNKLAYWDLVEAHPDHRGLWRITAKGLEFLRGQTRVPQHVNVYNNRVLGFSRTMISANDVIDGFDLAELMTARAPYTPSLED